MLLMCLGGTLEPAPEHRPATEPWQELLSLNSSSLRLAPAELVKLKSTGLVPDLSDNSIFL